MSKMSDFDIALSNARSTLTDFGSSLKNLSDKFKQLDSGTDKLRSSSEDSQKTAEKFAKTVADVTKAFGSAAGKNIVDGTREVTSKLASSLGSLGGAAVSVTNEIIAAYARQTQAINDNAERSKGFSNQLKGIRQFLDNVEDTPIQEKINQVGETIGTLTRELEKGSDSFPDFISKILGFGDGVQASREQVESALANFKAYGTELRERQMQIGDTGQQSKQIGATGGNYKAVGARELGAYQIDHTAAMVNLLSQIAANTANQGTAAPSNPNSNFNGDPPWRKYTSLSKTALAITHPQGAGGMGGMGGQSPMTPIADKIPMRGPTKAQMNSMKAPKGLSNQNFNP